MAEISSIGRERRVYTRMVEMVTMEVHEEERLEAAPGFEPGIKDLQSSALPLGHAAGAGAGDGTRTRDNHVGNVELYQLSHSRVSCNTNRIIA